MRKSTRETELIDAKFICGWAEFLSPMREPVYDSKGIFDYYKDRPGKIVVRLLVELENGECAVVYGNHKEAMLSTVRGGLKAAFPSKMKECQKVAGKAYKKNERMAVKKITYENGKVIFAEVEE